MKNDNRVAASHGTRTPVSNCEEWESHPAAFAITLQSPPQSLDGACVPVYHHQSSPFPPMFVRGRRPP